MKRIYLSVIAVAMLNLTIQAQDCSNGRYVQEIFTDTLISDVIYGNNDRYNGSNIDLFVDIRKPAGDTVTNRPLIIIAHGGSFLGGSRAGTDVVPLAQEFARKGYVTASISYRIGIKNYPTPGPDSSDASEAVMRATQDARAAVRFFRKSVAEDGNPYGINPDMIFLAGVSAGGFMALHLAYLDTLAEIPSFIHMTEPGLSGGIEGESGSPGYSSTVTAIVNMAGALGDVEWMKAEDTPVLSLHGDQDETVPFYTDMILLAGFYELMVVDGSHSVHQKAQQVILTECFKPFWGAGHIPHVGGAGYYDTTSNYMTGFLQYFVCNPSLSVNWCEYTDWGNSAEVGLKEIPEMDENVKLYPNPASDALHIESETRINNYYIYDFTGKLITRNQNTLKEHHFSVNISNMNAGVYFIMLDMESGVVSGKFVVQ